MAGVHRTKLSRPVLASCLLLLAACHGPKQERAALDAAMSLDAAADAGVDTHDTARALALLEPLAAESGEEPAVTVLGEAVLWEHGPAVTLRLDIEACKPGAMYQARLQDGSDCSDRTLAADAWSAGEGIGVFGCLPNGSFIKYYARRADSDQPWTISGSPRTNVVGHALVLTDVSSGRAAACGVIKRAPDAPLQETTDTVGPTVQIRGAIAGVCVFDRQVAKVKPGCPDFAAATACASTYCELNRCIDSCAEYVKCLAQMRGVDICVAAYSCELSDACASCQSEVVRCEVDLCLDTLSCAEPPTPDGPCSKLEACCSMDDADSASCLDFSKNLAHFGDTECQHALDNWKRIGKPCPAD